MMGKICVSPKFSVWEDSTIVWITLIITQSFIKWQSFWISKMVHDIVLNFLGLIYPSCSTFILFSCVQFFDDVQKWTFWKLLTCTLVYILNNHCVSKKSTKNTKNLAFWTELNMLNLEKLQVIYFQSVCIFFNLKPQIRHNYDSIDFSW